MEVVVAMFQRLGLRTILFTKKGGALGGILTKMVRLLLIISVFLAANFRILSGCARSFETRSSSFSQKI